jgi:soluble lytic murein transglycosylase-like protein
LIARLVAAVCRGAAAAGGAGRRPAVRTAGGQRPGQPAAAIADRASPEPQFPSIQEKVDWLTEMSGRLSRRIPEREARLDLLKTVYYEAKRAGLDPQMVLGLIQVESGFKKYAVSSAGARGYMQVMPFWVGLIGDKDEQPVPHAHQPALRLHHPAPLPRHRERRPLPRARPLQRQPGQARVSEHGARGVGKTVGMAEVASQTP